MQFVLNPEFRPLRKDIDEHDGLAFCIESHRRTEKEEGPMAQAPTITEAAIRILARPNLLPSGRDEDLHLFARFGERFEAVFDHVVEVDPLRDERIWVESVVR